MSEIKKQVFVHQIHFISEDTPSREEYVVDKTVNTIDPSINKTLTRNQVNTLINQGVKVTITYPK